MNNLPRIVASANLFPNGIIILGVRHWDMIMVRQADQMWLKGGNEIQGFVDNRGQFYDRKEAMELVKQNGQPFDPERNSHHNTIDECTELYSEGVW